MTFLYKIITLLGYIKHVYAVIYIYTHTLILTYMYFDYFCFSTPLSCLNKHNTLYFVQLAKLNSV